MQTLVAIATIVGNDRPVRLEDLGAVGNCQFAALADRRGAIVWCCLPRFDAEPVFGSLLDGDGGEFLVGPAAEAPGRLRYLENSNVLETTFDAPDGSFRVVDFAPRFFLHERVFRPTQLVRIVEPVSGAPRVRILCDPRLGWSKGRPARVAGSNHVDYRGFADPLRLTTDIPLTFLDGTSFPLTGRRHLVLAWGSPVEEPLPALCTRFLAETLRYWRSWVKHCAIPPLYQREVIRSALALKLHCFEDTGAIVASLTTSIPESPDSGRTWDYRYCWLRDSYYVLDALRLLGHFEERERFVAFLLQVAGNAPGLDLAPVYRVDGRADLEERIVPGWAGFEGHGPVRHGNAAALHRQNDVFGEMVLALLPVFLDERFAGERNEASLDLVEGLARKAVSVFGSPDAGIWEFRKGWSTQTFSSLMCWAAADRMAGVAARHRPGVEARFRAEAARMREAIASEAWCAAAGRFASDHGGSALDASLLQMAPLRFLGPQDPRLQATIDAVRDGLAREGWLLRYREDDGLGVPSVAFVLCTFWLVDALAATGRASEAREVMDRVHAALPPLGLLAEDYETGTGRMWGNFPQAYSHVGLIHAAFAASPRWSEVL
jgi:GH15 family glucan-1,4-alpha-glucosidase